jgi:DCN1-like protein 4/5
LLLLLHTELKTNYSLTNFYIDYILSEDKKKCIEVPVACELLNLVLGLQFRPQVDKLTSYLKVMVIDFFIHLFFRSTLLTYFFELLQYQTEYKVINMDQWMGFYRFCNVVMF